MRDLSLKGGNHTGFGWFCFHLQEKHCMEIFEPNYLGNLYPTVRNFRFSGVYNEGVTNVWFCFAGAL